MLYNWDSYYQDITDKRVSCPSTAKTCGWSAAATDEAEITVEDSTTATAATAPAAAKLAPMNVADLTGGPAPVVDAAAAKSLPAGLVTRTKTRKMPGHLRLACKRGQMTMYAEALAKRRGSPRIRYTDSGARVLKDKSLRGHRVTLQLTCRKRSAKTFAGPHMILGSKSADRIKTRRPRTGVFAGPGKDWVSVASHGSFAHGGLHADRIKVKAADGVATGDAGRDVLKAKTRSRALLVGGQNADKLVGSRGPTRINAADGSGDDVVVCHGHRNLVLADSGDTVRGHCDVVRRVKG